VITALLMGAALAGPLGLQRPSLDRVDLLSEDPGTWIHYEAPTFGTYPTRPGLRFVTQVKPVWNTRWEGVTLGTSLSSQSLVVESPLLPDQGVTWSAGVQSILLFPRGATAGVAWRWKFLRVGAGVSAVSAGTWSRPGGLAQWTVLPTLGVGVGPSRE